VIQTFMVVFVSGRGRHLYGKPVYRTSAKILVRRSTYNVRAVSADNPLVGLSPRIPDNDILNPNSKCCRATCPADAYKDGDVPPGSAHSSTSGKTAPMSLKLLVESNTPDLMRSAAKALPNTYLTT